MCFEQTIIEYFIEDAQSSHFQLQTESFCSNNNTDNPDHYNHHIHTIFASLEMAT